MPPIVPVEKHPFRRDDLAALLVGTLPDTKAPTASDATLDSCRDSPARTSCWGFPPVVWCGRRSDANKA